MDGIEILSQKQTVDVTGMGGFHDVMEVTFKVTATGTVASVRIPVARYTADYVSEVVRERAAGIQAVANL